MTTKERLTANTNNESVFHPHLLDLRSRLMKNQILLCTAVLLVQFVGQGWSQELATPLSRFDLDAGAWGGVHSGVQTNGAPVEKRLSVMIHYEYRFRDSFGLIAAMQFWKTRFLRYDGVETHEYFSPSGSLMTGMKLRYPFRSWTPNATCGVGTGMGQAPFLLFYSLGWEIRLPSIVSVAFELRRTTIQEDSFFLLAGIVVRLDRQQ